LVDADDYPWIIQNSWNYGWHVNSRWKYYAKRNVGAYRSTVYLHREIQKRAEPMPEEFMAAHHVDHANGQSLDDRKKNLRWATPAENRRNSRVREQIPTLETIIRRLLRSPRGVASMEPVPF
jgi:hypothetical protein